VVLHRVGHRRFRRISRGLGMFAQQADCVRGIGDPPRHGPCAAGKDTRWPAQWRRATYAPPRPAPTSRSRSRLLRTTDRPTRRYTQTEVCVKPGTLHTVQVA
jgi:hypothetical protein